MDYRECKGSIPIDIKNDEYISIERNSALKMYGVGFQPAKCIPEIPEWFFNKYIPSGSNSVILEPFAGSGTTILEALKNNNSVYWIDNNPLSRLICECKSFGINTELLEKSLNTVMTYVRKAKDVEVTMVFANIDLWFQKPVQEALTIIKDAISKEKEENVKKVLLLALSITVRKMSEMEDSMILAARRANNREIIEYSRDDVYENYENNVRKIIGAYEEWNPIVGEERKSFQIMTNDARNIDKEFYFDAVVTSPPYINAMDYIWASKFELHWLDLVSDDKNRLEVSSEEIGTERIPAKIYKELAVTNNEELNRILEDIYSGKVYKATKGQNELRSRVTYQYFEDMRKHFESAYKALKKDGLYCFIIGDTSKICGVEIPVANMLRDIANEMGFNEIFRFNLLLKNRKLNIPRASFAGTIQHDTVIVLKK
jgi:16S rRNA G966 N2-methylase RsmD